MQRVIAKYSSHDEADRASREYYRQLTPQQRLDILFDLIDQFQPQTDALTERFQRVYRIVKFSPR